MSRLEDCTFAEDQSPLENLSVRIVIQKGMHEILVMNPTGIITLAADTPTATIFHKPDGFDRFYRQFKQDPRESVRRMVQGDYSSPGQDPQQLMLYLQWRKPETRFGNEVLHPPWWDLEAEDDAGNKLLLSGSRGAYVRVANAWRPGRSWYDMLAAAGAVPAQSSSTQSSGLKDSTA